MAQHKLDRALDRMVWRLVKKFDPDKIILFGSHACVTAGPDSDIDLFSRTSHHRLETSQADGDALGVA